MTDLGDLLVLLHGARDRVSTVRAEVRTWRHVRVSHEAMARRIADGGFVAYGPAEEPECESFESRVRLWLAPPDRAREEREEPSGASFGVRRGRLWWQYDPHNGAMFNEAQPEVGAGRARSALPPGRIDRPRHRMSSCTIAPPTGRTV